MAYSTTTSPQEVWPEPVSGDGDSGSVELSSVGDRIPSDWMPLTAAPLDVACLLTGVTIRPTFSTFFSGGTGGPGSQVEIGADVDDVVTRIAAYPFHNANSFAANSSDNGMYFPSVYAIDLLPAGCTPVARLITAQIPDAGNATYRVQASYYEKPVNGTVWSTTSPQIVIPDAVTMIIIPSGGGSYVDGSPVTIRAASGPALVITGMFLWTNDATTGTIECDLYANGTLVWTEQAGYGGKQGMPYSCHWRKALDAFPEDCLIEGITRDDVGGRNIYVYLFGHEKPL